MFKMVLKDFLGHIPSEMKNMNRSGWLWQFIYFGCLVPIIFFQGMNRKRGLFYYSFELSMLAGLFLIRVCPNRMNKTLLLCPLSLRERKSYVYIGFAIRIVLSVLIYGLCNVPLYFFWKLPFPHLGIEFLFFLMYIVSIHIYVPPVVPSESAFERKYNLPGCYAFWDMLAQVNGLLGMVFMVAAFRINSDSTGNWKYIPVGICMLLECIVMLVMLFRYFPPVMQQAMQCENTLERKENERNHK